MTSEAISRAWDAYVRAQYGPPQALRKREFIAGWEAARGELRVRDAEKWREGERHESEYLNTWGQFCPHGDACNPYRAATRAPELSREEANRVEAFGLHKGEECNCAPNEWGVIVHNSWAHGGTE